ncbi:MAG TPA: DNA gyrase modulator, partial [Candidatus Limnocylindrales bacterium]|nr:DNA gyrase modulator [Candidatus Limnocylindrales bacterium]
MDDLATAAVEAALSAGARYADARAMETRAEEIAARNGVVESLERSERAGIGVRALIGSSWGFFAVPEASTAAARRAGERAAEIARASTLVPGAPLELAPVPPQTGSWQSRCDEDPWSVTVDEKASLLEGVTRTMQEHGATVGLASSRVWDTRKWLVTSEGTHVDQ